MDKNLLNILHELTVRFVCTNSILFWLMVLNPLFLVFISWKLFHICSKSIIWFTIIILRAFDFEHARFVLFIFYILQFEKRIWSLWVECEWMSVVNVWGDVFLGKMVNSLKLLIVSANDFGFDVSSGYEFAFEFILSQ